MLRLLRAITRRHTSQEPMSDSRITPEMARKLFGESELMPVPQAVPESLKPADPKPEAAPLHLKYTEQTPKTDPFEEVRRAAEAELRFRALLEATTGKGRRERAQDIPELRSPHPYLSELEGEVLTLVYVEGMAYTDVGRRHGLSSSIVKRMAQEALCYVAFYKEHPERAGERVPRCFNPGFQQFMMAKSVEEKRFTAKRHPELKVLLEKLTEREAEALHAFYWEDQTFVEAGERMGITHERVRQLVNKGVRKLNYDDSRKLQWREEEAKRENLIQVLRRLPTLEQAASALELTPEELLACLRRMEIAPSVASPDRIVRDDPRVEALREAKAPTSRRRVAASHPELRPPHVFLSANENKTLEWLYWRGMSYEEATRGLRSFSVQQIKGFETSALEELSYYLRHQPVSYYRLGKPDA